ncbi:MAG: hypothetical protein IJR00_00660 [Lachnospiraceae bacterium]|nr:hypothetical protein [Lachnospiraceae bacterium]
MTNMPEDALPALQVPSTETAGGATAPAAHPALPGKTLYTDKYGNYCVG